MKTVASILALAVALTGTVPVSAGDRGHSDAYRSHQHHRSGGHHSVHRVHHHHPKRHRHHRPVHHRAHVYHHNSHKGEYLVGGIMLGALLNELASERRQVTTTTSYVVSNTPARAPGHNPSEFLLDRDGRCYVVEYRGETRVLTAVDTINCR